MPPVLYAAQLTDLAKPVETAVVKEKKPRKNKKVQEVSPEPETGDAPIDLPNPNIEITITPPAEEAPKPIKKERTEKQIEAFERAKESRRLRKEAKEADRLAKLDEERLAQEALEAKKQMQREKRRLTREAKMTSSEPCMETLPPKKRAKKDDSPPAWFNKFITNINTEKARMDAEPKPQKQIRHESAAQAQTQWKDPLTRSRVTSEVDNHFGRMFNMIFEGRKV